MNSIPELSIVLPCYNESKSIPEILKLYSKVNEEIKLELVLVNNGSTDNSRDVIDNELKKAEYKFAKKVEVEKNIGYGHGIQSGLIHCCASAVGYSHSDLQCSPNDTLRAYKLYKDLNNEPAFLVKGKRSIRQHRDEQFVSSFYSRLCWWVMGYPLGDVNGQPKVFDRSLILDLLEGPKDFSFDLFVLYVAVKKRMLIHEFDVAFDLRLYGESKWASNRVSKVKNIIKAIMNMFQIKLGRRWSPELIIKK